MIKVFRYRVKSLNGLLNQQARAVNFVWNFCNDTQKHALKWNKPWVTGFDLNKLTAGSSKELGVHSGTVNATCEQFAKSRRQFKKPYLRYRGKRSLGWVPFKGRDLKLVNEDAFRFNGREFKVFYSRPLPEGCKIKDGSSFAQDAKGNWYLNIVVETPDAPAREINTSIGIDLGLKDFANLSNGEKISNPRYYRSLQDKLAIAQRARKKRQVKTIHAKIANSRNDFLHKVSTKLVQQYDYIAIGKVNSKGLAKTKMAKSVLDASWSTFRSMLRYKAIAHGAWFEEVNESYTTQTCSCCGSIPPSSPKGRAGLGIREWVCSDCGARHDRDTNAAINILRLGHQSPVEGILLL